MYLFRLFHSDRPFTQLDARLLADGQLRIGRDPTADWVLDDDCATLSRIHCRLVVTDGRLLLTDTSSNGTFLDSGERLARGEPTELALRQSFHLGPLMILVDEAEAASSQRVQRSQTPKVVQLQTSKAPLDWSDALPAPLTSSDASLLQAFCDGAKLDASALSSEDAAEVMRRVGAIYQQTVLGLATLMSDRARFKADHELEHTTISASDNNPFKWTPTRKLAQDLLRPSESGFLSDAEAVAATFSDLGVHLNAVAKGAQAAVALTVETLAPDIIDAQAKAQGGLLKSRAAVCWSLHTLRHAELTGEDGAAGPVERAFAQAYVQAASAPRDDALRAAGSLSRAS